MHPNVLGCDKLDVDKEPPAVSCAAAFMSANGVTVVQVHDRA